MYFNLYIANNTYYLIIDHPKNAIEWILTGYGTKICTLKTDNKKQGIKAVTIIALLHWLEDNPDIKTNTYIHTIKESKLFLCKRLTRLKKSGLKFG